MMKADSRQRWVASSYSGANGGQCVEWAPDHAHTHGLVPVRDSKNPHGPALAFEASAWSAFVAGIKAGEFTV
ncbi:DUF397 domain-containing protein [Streptomyces zagrosensis]|uniref:DUF397 domain-containing protein n=1 Tax=Streptomyces zagrosensis TaxID=1042984 RepID=A0A7W9UZ82_9ACTN|nr:DUF397 domain-containing protein [Streptomyces zagrosensis]MBB5936723.1 hypothetical protein [Streptomyces zagrosensis]